MTYGKHFLIAVDQFVNTLLGGGPDETFHRKAGKFPPSVIG